jgi:(1->4)-alpha-D-glucan 1-alpha-D-glucosylmutase
MLLLRNMQSFQEKDRKHLVNFVMELQQLTGPVMAKGLEDTAFYVYNRLVSLNEVGGHPEHFGSSVADFHEENSERQQRFPHSMLTTSTHDTKRSEDVRARINVLSEVPDEWRAVLNRWSRMNASKKTEVDGSPAPSRNDEYLLYQSLIGVWNEELPQSPEFAQFRDRVIGYMEKATREAKVHTSWVNPNEAYDEAMRTFLERVLDDRGKNNFLQDFMKYQRRIAFYGQFNALSQVLLKLTAPGMPDTYQGTELWDFSLVDPDNRRAVDYQLRSWLLSGLKRRISQGEDRVLLAHELLDNSFDGRIKLYTINRILTFRRDYHALFAEGDYAPLDASGEQQDFLFAFARTLARGSKSSHEMVVVVPRLLVGLTDGEEQPPLGEKVWKDTRLHLPHAQAGQSYENLFTGEKLTTSEQQDMVGLAMADVCAHFPVALLTRV